MTGTYPDQKRRSWLDIVAVAALAVALVLAFTSPPEATQGNVARLFYLHVPVILVAYGCFITTLIGGAGYLITQRRGWDNLAVSAAEVGVLMTGLTIVVGMIWAKPVWGVYWTWSARLTLTAVLFFTYLGYLAIRRAIEDPISRARRAAVYGILSVGLIPLVHFSVIWWRDVHQAPTLIRPDEMQIDGELLVPFFAGMVAYLLVGIALVARRYQLAALEVQLEDALRTSNAEMAGDAVRAPTLDGGA